jgi:hypothetical protein
LIWADDDVIQRRIKSSPTLPAWLLFMSLLLVCISVHAGEHIKVTTWNLNWFPNGSMRTIPIDQQQERIRNVAKVIKQIDPDILLLQEVSGYDACTALIAAIGPDSYQVDVCSVFPGRQQEAILLRYLSMEGAKFPANPPRRVYGFLSILGSSLQCGQW